MISIWRRFHQNEGLIDDVAIKSVPQGDARNNDVLVSRIDSSDSLFPMMRDNVADMVLGLRNE